MRGSHIPLVCIAKQYLKMNHFQLCEEYLLLAAKLCSWDPHLEHELAVVYFRLGRYRESIQRFEALVKSSESVLDLPAVFCNLGQCYLRIKCVYSLD